MSGIQGNPSPTNTTARLPLTVPVPGPEPVVIDPQLIPSDVTDSPKPLANATNNPAIADAIKAQNMVFISPAAPPTPPEPSTTEPKISDLISIVIDATKNVETDPNVVSNVTSKPVIDGDPKGAHTVTLTQTIKYKDGTSKTIKVTTNYGADGKSVESEKFESRDGNGKLLEIVRVNYESGNFYTEVTTYNADGSVRRERKYGDGRRELSTTTKDKVESYVWNKDGKLQSKYTEKIVDGVTFESEFTQYNEKEKPISKLRILFLGEYREHTTTTYTYEGNKTTIVEIVEILKNGVLVSPLPPKAK